MEGNFREQWISVGQELDVAVMEKSYVLSSVRKLIYPDTFFISALSG